MDEDTKEKLLEVLGKVNPRNLMPRNTANKKVWADYDSMCNQFNHTLYELYQNDLISEEEYSSRLIGIG